MHMALTAEPAVLDFGSVLVNTEVEKYISVKNFSKRHIKVGLKVSM